MGTSMKKLEIYTAADTCRDLAGILNEMKLYWYRETVSLRGEGDVCKVTVYAPIHALGDIVSRVAGVLDLRRIENAIIVGDVESGIGAPYRITGRRFITDRLGLRGRPLFMILEEAIDKSHISMNQLALAAIASLVAMAGLLLDNPYIIIGAMLLSPILGPIYAFSILASWGHPRKSLTALASLALLLSVAVLAPLLASVILLLAGLEPTLTSEIQARAEAGWGSLAIPVLLGLASILAVSSSTWEALTGVAIAAALIPPASALALGLAGGWMSVVYGSSVNLLLNVAGLLVGGMLAALVLRGR